MKKIFLTLIGFISFFPLIVDAASRKFDLNLVDSCVDEHTCVLLCGYTHEVRTTADIVQNANYEYRSLYIYYHFDDANVWQIDWYSGETNIKYALHSKSWPTLSVHKDNVFMKQSSYFDLKDNGICPTGGYVDTSGFGVSSEACFDSDGKYCTVEDPGGAGTDFKGKASKSTLEYNYIDQITTHFEDWSFNEVQKLSCSEVLKQENAEKAVEEQVTSFDNFLYGNNMPEFMKNNLTYKEKLNEAKQKYTERVTECKDSEINRVQNDDTLTETQKKEEIAKIEQSAQEITGIIDSTDDKIENIEKENTVDSSNINKIEFKEGCSIFSNDLKSWLIQLLNLIKIGGLILTLVLGMFDFFKGVTSGEADAMKKIWKSFSRRLISLIILFLLPLLIEFLFGLINVSGINSSNPLCGIK